MKKAYRSYLVLTAIAVLTAFALAACGGSDDPTATPRPTGHSGS